MTEILAPAGDEQSAYAAINAGADAIYLGLTAFSARSSAKNFDFSALEMLLAYAHALDVKIYVAMNTLVKQSEVSAFIQTAVKVWNIGADAIIIQDMYLGGYIKKTYPQIKLHLSTQAGVNNEYGAKLALRLGFDRVILARETRLEDIKKIAEIIETEVFVQGALCTCFSGQCYLSSFAGGNSGNRGKCKQPCRKVYSIDRKGFEEEAYRLSLSDLSVGENIFELIACGVSSFKIEGRMRRPEYVSAAVGYYKSLLEGRAPKENISALKRTYNRGNYTRGLAFGQDKSFISSAVQGHIGEYVGAIKVESGKFLCVTSEKCAEGDCFKILRGGRELCGAAFSKTAKGGFYVSSKIRLKNGDKVFITTDASLNQTLLDGKKTKKIEISGRFQTGERAEIFVDGHRYESNFVLERASTRPLSEEDIRRCFGKTDTYPFEVTYGEIIITGGSFVPASMLNAFRREVFESYYKIISADRNERIETILPLPEARAKGKNNKTAVISRTLKGLKADIGILKPDDYHADFAEQIKQFDGEKFLFLPAFMSGAELERVIPSIAAFDGVYCDGYYAAELCAALGKKLFAGTGFNIGNETALSAIDAEYIALSKELTAREAKEISSCNTFYLTEGNIKVMDLIYCPFGKSCNTCDKRATYSLTDENGRVFPMRRYKTEECRFELFNCADLISDNNFTGSLLDCTLCSAEDVLKNSGNCEELKKYFKNYTRGHSENPVL